MLELFILETCPYCRKVMDFLENNNIKFQKFDISNNTNLLRLLALGGKEQVPFLFDESNEKKLYESDEIIKYLEKFIQD